MRGTWPNTGVVGRRYSAIFGFENEADATKAMSPIRKAAPVKKK